MANFGNLYDYSTANGIVIPQTSTVKATIENAFKEIFGASFSTNAATTNGRLIEALALLFVDTIGINAQNVNGFNITQAAGAFLEGLGKNWGILRLNGESDTVYRARIIASASRGSGFAASIRQAIAATSTSANPIRSVVVLDNGNEDPQVLPQTSSGEPEAHGIAVDAHSVFICVRGGVNASIAAAIRDTKSAGCGFSVQDTPSIASNLHTETLTDSDTGTSFTAKWYVPKQRYVKFTLAVTGTTYTGTDITADTKAALVSFLDDRTTNDTITKAEIISAIALYGKNIVCSEVTISVSDTASPTASDYVDVDELIIYPYMYISTGDTDEEKASFLENNITVSVS